MKLLDILRKLGILRYGAAAGTYSSAKDAPEGLVGGRSRTYLCFEKVPS